MKNGCCWLLLAAMAVSTGACVSSRAVPYEAGWKANTLYYDGTEADQTDMKSRLRFGVRNNETTLFVTLKTREPEMMRKIISNGIRMSFKPGESRKEAGTLTFPVILKQDRRAIRRMDNVELYGQGMRLLLETFNKEALWKGAGEAAYFVNLVQANQGIVASVELSPEGEMILRYELLLAKVGMEDPLRTRLFIAMEIDDSGRSGFAPGVSIGVGGGGMGMGGMGVGIGTGGRNAYGNQSVALRLDVQLARQTAGR